MKLLKITIAFALLVSLQIAAAQWLDVPPPVEAKNLMMFTAGVPVVAASCSTTGQACLGGVGDADSNINWYYTASSFTASESTTICSVDLTLKKVGTPVGTHKVGIYTNNPAGCSGVDCPGTLVGNFSDNYNNADLTTSFAVLNRTTTTTGLNAAVVNTTKYWLVLYSSLGSFNAAPYPQGNDVCGNTIQQSDDGTNWTATTVIQLKYQFYK